MIYPQVAHDLAKVWRDRLAKLPTDGMCDVGMVHGAVRQCAEELDELADFAANQTAATPNE